MKIEKRDRTFVGNRSRIPKLSLFLNFYTSIKTEAVLFFVHTGICVAIYIISKMGQEMKHLFQG